jgi:outer membrane protein assembly factor BamB
MRRLIFTLAIIAAVAVTVTAADWPQYLGPDRNGVYKGPPIADTWGPSGPSVVWRKTIGQGFAGPAVAGNRVLIFHRVKNEEVLE